MNRLESANHSKQVKIESVINLLRRIRGSISQEFPASTGMNVQINRRFSLYKLKTEVIPENQSKVLKFRDAENLTVSSARFLLSDYVLDTNQEEQDRLEQLIQQLTRKYNHE